MTGVLIGWRYQSNNGSGRFDRLKLITDLVEENYVDTINLDSIEESVIPVLLSQLDPHSTYLPARLNKVEEENLQGSFQGIGVQFNRMIDTVVVIRVVKGGASERAGLKAGDRILKADTASLVGGELSNDFIMKQLKGPADSSVDLTIMRGDKVFHRYVVRGPVPISSIDAHYMLSDSLLYIKIKHWGATTHQEFQNAYLEAMKQTAVKGMIIDLRGNGGGYLQTALILAGAFLPKDQLLLSTKGRAYPEQKYSTEYNGIFVNMPLTVLIDEFSASASEIFAGIIQDYDRGLIIGRRSFGKGLVQEPFTLSDGSAVRLTVARYYTPSGRSIQKDYSKGLSNYVQDLRHRYEGGELFNEDSIQHKDSLIYTTMGGREVYGGGGITPDLFVPRDSTGLNSYSLRLIESQTLPKFAFLYADSHREELLQNNTTTEELYTYLSARDGNLLWEYARYASENEGLSGQAPVPIRTTLLYRASKYLLSQLKAMIADQVASDMGAYYEIVNKDSQEVLFAVEALNDGSWEPEIQIAKE